MTFLDKLDLLMKSSGLNKHKLSIISGVPYTTIDGFYKKGYENAKISTIRKIARALGCSLDYLIDEDIASETKKSPGTDESEPRDEVERDIIGGLRRLHPQQQVFLLAWLKTVDSLNQQNPSADLESTSDTFSISPIPEHS